MRRPMSGSGSYRRRASIVWRSVLPRGAWAVLLMALMAIGGCRVFRGQRVSDADMAAARQLSLQGIDAQQRQQWERAESLFAAAIIKCPSDERARYGYAEALWQRGQWQQALVQMDESVRLSAGDPQRRVRLGQMHRATGDLAQARGQAEEAIAGNPQMAAAWALKGQLLMAQGQRNEALANFHRALSFDAELPEVQLAIADIYAAENKPQRALATLQSLAQSSPQVAQASEITIRQARALAALGRRDDALNMLAQAGRRDNAAPEILRELATVQLAAGDTSAARATIELGLSRFPADPGFRSLSQESRASGEAVVPAAAATPIVTPLRR
jgi:tetratricopeptide (TPR) repeat protein